MVHDSLVVLDSAEATIPAGTVTIPNPTIKITLNDYKKSMDELLIKIPKDSPPNYLYNVLVFMNNMSGLKFSSEGLPVNHELIKKYL